MLYASIFQKNVAVYHLINGRYKKIFEYPFGKKSSESSDDVHLLLREGNHFKFLTINTDTDNWNTVQRYDSKKMKYHQKSMSTKHKCFGDTPLVAADGNFADPVATEDSAVPLQVLPQTRF